MFMHRELMFTALEHVFMRLELMFTVREHKFFGCKETKYTYKLRNNTPHTLCLCCIFAKKVSEKFGAFTFIHLLCPRKGALCALVRCLGAVPYWLNRSVMLFLQAENVGNFQSLQKV